MTVLLGDSHDWNIPGVDIQARERVALLSGESACVFPSQTSKQANKQTLETEGIEQTKKNLTELN